MNNKAETSVNSQSGIQETEGPLKELADAMPLLVWIANTAGKVVYYNQKVHDYSGSTTDKNGNWIWEKLIHPGDLESSLATWNESVLSRKTYEKEHLLKMADGLYQWHLSRAIPKINDDGNLVCWYGTGINIHAQKMYGRENENGLRRAPEKTGQRVAQQNNSLKDVTRSLENNNHEIVFSKYN